MSLKTLQILVPYWSNAFRIQLALSWYFKWTWRFKNSHPTCRHSQIRRRQIKWNRINGGGEKYAREKRYARPRNSTYYPVLLVLIWIPVVQCAVWVVNFQKYRALSALHKMCRPMWYIFTMFFTESCNGDMIWCNMGTLRHEPSRQCECSYFPFNSGSLCNRRKTKTSFGEIKLRMKIKI